MTVQLEESHFVHQLPFLIHELAGRENNKGDSIVSLVVLISFLNNMIPIINADY